MSDKESVPTLELCPFCPYPTERYYAVREVGWLRDREICQRMVAVCSQCGAQGPAFGLMSFNNEETAAQYWNRRANVSSNAVALTVDAMWEALKAVCCKFPTEAKLAVFVSENKFKEALAPFAAATTPAPVEQEET